MAAKLDIKQAKKYFKEQGCRLLENEYVNAHAKMRYICSCGNESSVNWNNFKNGRRCGCGRNGIRRLTKDEIKRQVESKGLKLVSHEHDGLVNIVTCKCRCGSIRTCKLSNLRNNDRCRECLYKEISLDIDHVGGYFARHGCELLDGAYKNARTKLKYRCSCGNISQICFQSFKNGNRCRQCGSKKLSEWLSKNRKGDKHPNWIKDRKLKKESDNFRSRCRSMVRRTLKFFNQNKNNRTQNILGYGHADLKLRIESHENWLTAKDAEWHIDHIFPLKAFVEHGILNVALANCLENLQPMVGKDNMSKSAKYDRESFKNWLKSKGINLETGKIIRGT